MDSHVASSRKEALEKGLPTYMPAKPCLNGNVSPRTAKRANCTCEECRKDRAKRSRANHRKHRDKRLESMREYYQENREWFLDERKKYVEKNYEKVNEDNRRLYLANRDRYNIRKRAWHMNNRDWLLPISRERSRLHYQENKESYLAKFHKRRATKIQATPAWYGELDEFVMQEAHELCSRREEETGMKWSVDHIIPLQSKEASGFHCATNIQVIPHHLNLSKGNRMMYLEPLEWLKDAQE